MLCRLRWYRTQPVAAEAATTAARCFPKLLPWSYWPGIELDLRTSTISTPDDFVYAARQINTFVERIHHGVRAGEIVWLAVFAFARIPLLVHLGAVLDDNTLPIWTIGGVTTSYCLNFSYQDILKRKMLTALRGFAGIAVGLLLLVGITGVATAATNSSSGQQGIAQSYQTDGVVRQGMIVSLKKGDNSKVVALTVNTLNDMFGVAISPTDAPITLSGDATSQVYVATSGVYNVLMSDQNGAVHTGDYISVSSLNGVGMLAQDTEGVILGRAAANLTAANLVQKGVSIKDANGKTLVVNIGVVPVTIGIGKNPNGGHGTGDLPGFLQVTASGIANKPVSAGRVYLALAFFLLAAFIAGSLLYSGVRAALLSIGRNPMAKKFIVRGLIQTILTGVIVFIVGIFGVYLLIRL